MSEKSTRDILKYLLPRPDWQFVNLKYLILQNILLLVYSVSSLHTSPLSPPPPHLKVTVQINNHLQTRPSRIISSSTNIQLKPNGFVELVFTSVSGGSKGVCSECRECGGGSRTMADTGAFSEMGFIRLHRHHSLYFGQVLICESKKIKGLHTSFSFNKPTVSNPRPPNPLTVVVALGVDAML